MEVLLHQIGYWTLAQMLDGDWNEEMQQQIMNVLETIHELA